MFFRQGKYVRLSRRQLSGTRRAYQFVAGDVLTKEFTPLNVGFGLTYVLPVIVAILAAFVQQFIKTRIMS